MSRLNNLRASLLLLCSLGLVMLSTRIGNSGHTTGGEWSHAANNVKQLLTHKLEGRVPNVFRGSLKPEAAATAPLIISEFRLRGPNGANDEFIEIYNDSDSSHTVSGPLGSTGYAVACSSNVALNDGAFTIKFIIPNGTVIPARGHYLGVNATGYSLAGYPAGTGATATADITFAINIPDNAGIALFETSSLANFTLVNRIDAVGSDAELNPIYREGGGYPALVGTSVDGTLYRKLPGGCTGSLSGNCTSVALITTTLGPTSSYPQDTGDNAADFVYADTNGTVVAPNVQRLGAPGPENLAGPVAGVLNPGLVVSRLDSSVSEDQPPNRLRDTTPGSSATSSFGTLSFRRRLTNNLGQPIVRLRFRIVDITTFPSLGTNCNIEPAPATCVADLRGITSTQATVTVNDAITCAPVGAPCSTLLQGTTLETPALQPNGGGYNSTWSAGAITAGTPLLNGTSINLQFLVGLEQTGVDRLHVLVEAIPRSGPAATAVIRLSGPPFPSPTPNTFQFSAGNFNVVEDVAAATITVNRSGNISTAATVDYATSDGTAIQRTDYTLTSGTLRFAAGEASKTFGVLISEDAYVEGNETLNITLTNPTGGLSLGSPSTAALTIIDDDTTDPPTVNPIDDARTFVGQHYHDFLAREGDQGGLDYWTDQLTSCGADMLCFNQRRVRVSDAFFFEMEYQETGSWLYRVYVAAFGTKPDYTNYMPDRGRIVGGATLDIAKSDFLDLFVQRAAFLAQYPGNMTSEVYVDTLNTHTGNSLTQAQRDALVNGLKAMPATETGATVLGKIVDNAAFIDREYNNSFVLSLYFGYLRRNAEPGGFDFWLAQINSAPLRDVATLQALVCSFITSVEYQNRFSSVLTHSNQECPQ